MSVEYLPKLLAPMEITCNNSEYMHVAIKKIAATKWTSDV